MSDVFQLKYLCWKCWPMGNSMDIHCIQCAVWMCGAHSLCADVQGCCCSVEKCILCVGEADLWCPPFPEPLLQAVGTALLQGRCWAGTDQGCSPCSVCHASWGEGCRKGQRRKGKAWFLGVSSACAGLLPGLMSSRGALARPGSLAARAPVGLSTSVNVTPGSGRESCAGSVL